MTLSPQLLAILVCPKCKGVLAYREADQALDCPACLLRYPVRDDIPVMLVDEATPL
ncbi:MAG: Trm112 family protein [Gemmatimonadetes bacterium]|nr:Trm112 family protein [Gemmatimonadota bacterium]